MARSKRKAISKGTRYAIFARDRFTCRYCGREAGVTVLVIDHIQPVALGGDNDPSNLITSCDDCNAGKGAKSPTGAVPTSEDRRRVDQERAELEQSAEAVRRHREMREKLFQGTVNILCAILERDAFDKRTAHIIARYIEEHGPDDVIEWIEIARERLIARRSVSDTEYGRYISGIRRRRIEQWQAEDALAAPEDCARSG